MPHGHYCAARLRSARCAFQVSILRRSGKVETDMAFLFVSLYYLTQQEASRILIE